METEVIQMLDGYRATSNASNIKTTHEINMVSSQHRTEEGMLHRADGLALSSFKENYHEWWDDGRLVAVLKNDQLSKSINGDFSGLKEAEPQAKWKGLESTLSLTDLNLCAFKQNLKTDINDKISSIRKMSVSDSKNNLTMG
jgi:hypothetical protein